MDLRLELLLTLRLRNEVDFDVGIRDTPDVHGRKVGGLIQGDVQVEKLLSINLRLFLIC